MLTLDKQAGYEIAVVIYDSPPAVAVTGAAVLSRRVDGVVLVIEAGRTRRDVARQAITNLQQAGAHMLGGVLNRAGRSRTAKPKVVE